MDVQFARKATVLAQKHQWTGAGPLAPASSVLFEKFGSDLSCELLPQDTTLPKTSGLHEPRTS